MSITKRMYIGNALANRRRLLASSFSFYASPRPVLDETYWVNDLSLIIFHSEETIHYRSWFVRGKTFAVEKFACCSLYREVEKSCRAINVTTVNFLCKLSY